MSDQTDRCEIKIVPHPIKGIELELSGDCAETQQIIKALPPRRQRYLKRRITIVD